MRALITGCTGQDAAYLAKFLLDKGYKVFGTYRRLSTPNFWRLHYLGIFDRVELIPMELIDTTSIIQAIKAADPDEVYHLAANSFVGVSFKQPIGTGGVTGLGVARMLEAIRLLKPETKFYQASCYSEDTRACTPEGIKEYKNLKVGDLVFTVSNKNEIETKKIRRIIISDYQGKIIHFKSRRFDFLVTPEHKMLLTKNGKLFYEEAKKTKELFRYARTSNISFVSSKWRGTRRRIINFKEFIKTSDYHYNTRRNIITKMATIDYLYLLGIYIGDGYVKQTKTAMRYCSAREFIKKRNTKGQFVAMDRKSKEQAVYPSNYTQFALPSNDKARPKVIRILDKYSIKYKETPATIDFSSYTLSRMFKQSGENVYKKHIPKWVLQLPSTTLENLYNGLIDSDGQRRGYPHERQSFTTTSKELVNDFVELCIKTGKIPKVAPLPSGNSWFGKEKRHIKSSGGYRINVSYKNTRKLYPHNILVEDYQGKVWCLEVEGNHNFLVERKGFVLFSGNSSELFGGAGLTKQNEETPFNPWSPYACAKLYGHQMTRIYREAYGMFACNGILFNHESSLRGLEFVTRKISNAVAKIALGLETELRLGNLEAKRDWGYAPEYVESMWLMLQQEKPDDYVIATGEAHSVGEFAERAFAIAGLNWEEHIKVDTKLLRPLDVGFLQGDYSKAKRVLGWEPKTSFDELVEIMVKADLERWERYLRGEHFAWDAFIGGK